MKDAAAHGFTGLLYRWLKESEAGRQLPAGLVDRLERQAVGLTARNLILAAELRAILGAFEARQLRCAPLRGLALAERLYGDITVRPMGDLDLVVRKDDLAEVARLLREQGFVQMDRRDGFAAAFSYTLEFVKERHGWIIVEPHWTLAYPPFVDRLDMEGVWKRCVRGRVGSIETWRLGREDLLLHLCLHLMHRDGTAPLVWFSEVDRLVRRECAAFDWSQLLLLARQAGVEFLVWRALAAVKAGFGTPIPDRVLDWLEREPPRTLEGRVVRLLAGGPQVDGKESLAVLFALNGLRARLGYAWALLFPSPEFMRVQYALTRRHQLGLAYVRRFCHLVWEGLKGVAALAFPGRLPRPRGAG